MTSATEEEEILGDLVPNWTPRPHPLDNPEYHRFQGQYCQLEILNSKTKENLLQEIFDVLKSNGERYFKYLRYGPFKTIDEFKELVRNREQPGRNTVMYAISANEKAVGFICLLRIQSNDGTIELSHVNSSEELARGREGTEAVFLLLQFVFDTLGYRRVEWKCNVLNETSRQAAIRFGFQYEGTWMKSTVVKGRSRDDAWYSLLDQEWILVKQEYQRWLNPENFDKNGQEFSALDAAHVNPRQN